MPNEPFINPDMLVISPHVLERLLTCCNSLPLEERLNIHKHLAKYNKNYGTQELEKLKETKRANHEEKKAHDQNIKYWRQLVNNYVGKTLYVRDHKGIRQVELHGSAYDNEGNKRKGLVEIRDDAWFRMLEDTVMSRVYYGHGFTSRVVVRKTGNFKVRIVEVSKLYINNPFSEELVNVSEQWNEERVRK